MDADIGPTLMMQCNIKLPLHSLIDCMLSFQAKQEALQESLGPHETESPLPPGRVHRDLSLPDEQRDQASDDSRVPGDVDQQVLQH